MLDASTRIDVLNLVSELKSRGLSVLFITHDLSLGYYISEKAVILYQGCIAEMGSTERIFDNPLHPYTQMLLASVPRLDKKWEKLEAELKTQRSEKTNGCVYYDRCQIPARDEWCTRDRISLREMEPDHWAACIKL